MVGRDVQSEIRRLRNSCMPQHTGPLYVCISHLPFAADVSPPAGIQTNLYV